MANKTGLEELQKKALELYIQAIQIWLDQNSPKTFLTEPPPPPPPNPPGV